MKDYIISNEVVSIQACDCGFYPEFIRPDPYYTHLWLECPNCHKKTMNTGGFWFAQEICLFDAKIKAAKNWNEGKFI